MIKNIWGIALFVGLASGQAFAVDNAYEQKLKELQDRIDVSFSNLPMLQKIEGVNHLHSLVFNPAATSYFSKTGVVQAVVLVNPFEKEGDGAARRCLLRGHFLVLNFNGADTPTVMNELPSFSTELTEIDALSAKLQVRMPNLVLERTSELPAGMLTTNRDYLTILRSFESALDQVRFSSKLRTFDRFNVIQTTSHFETTTIQKYPYQTFENGKLVRKSGLMLRIGHEGYYQNDSIVTTEQIRQLLEVVLVYDFDGIDYSILTEAQAQAVLGEFVQFLTPERVAKLKAKNIKRFNFSERFDREEELIKGDTLTLGIKLEDMVKVYDLLFAD